MTWSYDMEAAPEGREIMLACTGVEQPDQVCRVLAQRHWFDVTQNERVQGWRSNLDGERIDTWLTPYAWIEVDDPPDPDAFT